MELSPKILNYWCDASTIYHLAKDTLKHSHTIKLNDLDSHAIPDLEDGYYYLSPCLIKKEIHPLLVPVLVEEGKVCCVDFSTDTIVVSNKVEEILSGSYAYLVQQLQLCYEELNSVIDVVSFCNDILSSVWGDKAEISWLYFFPQKGHEENFNNVKGMLLYNENFDVKVAVTSEAQVAHASNEFALSVEQQNVLNKLNVNQSKVSLIDGAYGTGITTVMKNYVAQQMARAIIKGGRIPVFYKFKRGGCLFFNELQTWFAEEEVKAVSNGYADESLTNKYIKFTNKIYGLDVTNIRDAIEALKSNIIKKIKHFKQGEVLKYSLDEMNSFFSEKYDGYEGLKIKRSKLSIHLAKARQELNEAKILLSFWQRQLMNVPIYYRKLCHIKIFSKRIISKNRRYLLNLIDEDKLDKLAFDKIEQEIKNKIQDISKNITNLESDINELETDRGNLISASSKYAVWQRALKISDSMSQKEKQLSISTGVCNYIYNMLVWYWFGSQFINDNSLVDKDNVMIIIDDASIYPTFEVAKVIHNANKVILVKRNGAEEPRFIPEYIDDNLIHKHDILSDEVDQEELQFLGIGASSGNIWRYFAEIIDIEDILKLSTTYKYSKELTELLKKFDVTISSMNGELGEVRVVPVSGREVGLVNDVEAREIIDLYYSLDSDNCIVATTTWEQASYVKSTKEGYINACTIEEYIYMEAEYDEIILSLVFNEKSFLKPFEEKAFWQSILTKAKNKLFIVCDGSLFGSFSHGCMKKFDIYRKESTACIA